MKRWVLVVVSSFFIPLIALLFLEGTFRILKTLKDGSLEAPKIWQEKVVIKETIGGNRLLKIKAERDGELVWQVDEYVNEKTNQRLAFPLHNSKSIMPKEKHFITLGGSFAFGSNINYESTIAGQIEKVLPYVQSYNFGIRGGGPHEALAALDHIPTREVISSAPEEGITLYIIINDHIGRTIMDVAHIGDMSDRPHFEVIDGELNYRGSYSNAYPIKTKIFKLFSQSLFLRYLGFNPPIGDKLNLSDQHTIDFCSIIEEIKKKVKEIRPKTEFYAVFYPSSSLSFKLFSNCFKQRNISYLNYSLLFKDNPNEAFFKDDHPRPITNKVVSKKIIDEVFKKKK